MLTLSLNDLLEYTHWERERWHSSLREHGGPALAIPTGPHGDGRLKHVGDVIRHIFSAEQRYVERLLGRPLTDPASIPNHDLEALFQFGQHSRKAFLQLLQTFPGEQWDGPREYKILDFVANVTPRKIAVHILMHEIRHWAQIATLLRLNGVPVEFHDFLFSPVLGGEFRPPQHT